MDPEVLVYADIEAAPYLAGRLWTRSRKDRESASFEYDADWLAYAGRFSLEPALKLVAGPYHTSAEKALFGAIGDSAPDRWGRVLMRRAARRRAQAIGEMPRTLREIDYLLMVDDESRQGALRFAGHIGGPFLAESAATRIPPLVDLPRLLSAAQHVLSEEESDEDLRLLLAPGSSLGGARPKASVRDRDGQLAIAKFPNREDATNVVAWEAVALALAAKAGVSVPGWRLVKAAGKPVLIVVRFDREGGTRRAFLSAMSMLGARDNESRSYLEMADALRECGAEPKRDMVELWRRIVFSILISNTDDHLRNHAFLHAGNAGWRLSPAYDLNPVPADLKPRVLSTAINLDDATASLELALDVAGYFGLDKKGARRIAGEVGAAVGTWRKEAAGRGIKRAEVERMTSAFEHRDLAAARAL